MIIEFAGITFNDSGRGWVFADLIDWYTLPDSKASNEPRPQGHGSFNPGTDWRAAAAISFTAAYIGDSHAECLTAVEELIGSSSAAGTIQVTDALRTTSRQVSVRHIGVPDFFDYDTHEVHFAIDLLAWDPYRYGTEESDVTGLPTSSGGKPWPHVYPTDWGTGGESGRIELTNSGRAESWPVLEVTGELTDGFELTEILSGRVIRVERVIPEGSTVYIDNRSGQIWLDDPANSLAIFTTRYEWWSVPAGETRVVQFTAIGGSSGDPQLTGRIRPAY